MVLKSMPATPMTQEEMERQCQVVSEVARAADYFTDDELEFYAKYGNFTKATDSER